MSTSASPMRVPGRRPVARSNQACPGCGYEITAAVSGRLMCPKCGTDLEQAPAPSFRDKVRSSVPEPSQRLMDEILDDDQ
jgi:ribosomal protein S27AE